MSSTPLSSLPARSCPVCLGTQSKLLFQQTFATYSENSLMEGYDLVVCQTCGGGFASRIPDQKVFDHYYGSMTKYALSHHDGKISEVDRERFEEIVRIISPYLAKDKSIVDVGCANGGLLAEFKRQGFQRLKGFDPSSDCVEFAQRLYGIEVEQITINQVDQVSEKFDLVILTCVLEHICDVDTSLRLLTNILNPGGHIYIEVPDATRYHHWFSAPYQHFSMEHINYFSPRSLGNLLSRHGYRLVTEQRVRRYMSPNAVEPGVSGLYVFTGEPAPIQFDSETEVEVNKYIEICQNLENRINQVIANLAASQQPIAVWGTGTHTLRLLKTSELARVNIVAFLDSNANYQGKQLNGIDIIPPEKFTSRDIPILISSHVMEREIKMDIQSRRGWANPLICFYEDVPIALGE